MANKKRRKKATIATQLKYEVYGILLITISIIALSGEATVGRSLSKLFGLILGKFYFVLALVGVYVGLSVMVKRVWPKGWTSRRTGLLILVLGFTLSSSITEINSKLEILPKEDLTGGIILNMLSNDLKTQIISVPPEFDQSIRDKAISGGYVGALQYSILFTLFGYYGALLIMIVMFAISIMLITGKSYVDLARILKKRAQRMVKLMQSKLAKRSSIRAQSATSQANSQPTYFDDATIDDEDEDELPALPPKKKKSLFFTWKHQHAKEDRQEQDDLQDEWVIPQNHADADAESKTAWQEDQTPPWEDSSEPDPLADIGTDPASRSDADPDPDAGDIHNELAQEHTEERWDGTWPAEPSDEAALSAETGEEVHDDSESESLLEPQRPANEQSEALVTAQSSLENAPRRPISDPGPGPNEPKPYVLPPFSLLNKPVSSGKGSDGQDMFDSRRKLEATLESFGVRAKVLDVVRGPAVTRYEVQPATGVKVSRIVGLTDDIALALAAKDIRMEAPIPGKSAIGIEVPNMEVSVVTMREVMETAAFQNAPSKLSIAFGRDISGQTIVGNLARMPHLLVAGATGSGKSVCINGIITSILYKATPDEVKFLMIDPKMVELNVYNGIPHLLAPVVTNPRRASLALKKIVVEMEKRYELFSKSSTRNIEGYNLLMADNPAAVLPYIVVIVDELADLMMVAANDVEDAIARLAQMARAAGIHLIIATQRPSVDVITGVIKANIPSRIAFGVSSQVDSRTILDMAGAEKLLGRGDMLFLPVGMSKPIRVQGAFLSDQEVETLVAFTRDQAEAEYKEDLVPEVEEETESDDGALDELFDQAVQIVLEAKQASVSLLQRRMRIGYTRAARIIDQLEAKSIVGPYEGSKPREVLMTLEQFQSNQMSS